MHELEFGKFQRLADAGQIDRLSARHAARTRCTGEQAQHLELTHRIVGELVFGERFERQALQGIARQQGRGLVKLLVHSGFAAAQRVVVHRRHVVVHQRIAVDEFHCGGGVLHTSHIRAGKFAGRTCQQRAHTFAATNHRVAHGFVQALRGDIFRWQ